MKPSSPPSRCDSNQGLDSKPGAIQCVCDSRSAQASLLRAGDIVFARTGGTTGKSFLITECPADAVFASYLIRVRFANSVEPRYVNHYFQSPSYWAQISRGSRGAAQPGVNATTLKSLQIPLPPLDDQKRIAHLLGKVEGLIAQRKQHLQQLDALLKSVFLEMFGDPIKNEKGWPIEAFENHVSRITKGESPKWQGFGYLEKGVRFVTSENVNHGKLDLSKAKFIHEDFHKKLLRSQLCVGDLLVNLVGASVGRCAIVTEDTVPANINQAVATITLSGKALNRLFLLWLFTSESFQRHLLGNVVDAARANLSLGDLRKLQIPFPPYSLQNQFAAIVEKLEGIKSHYQQSLTDLEALYGALSQKAFAGELDLSRVRQ